MKAKEFYRTYLADNNTSELSDRLVKEILNLNPNHTLEMGCGTGKNLRLINSLAPSIAVSGIDISLVNVLHSIVKNGLQNVALGDESHLRHYCNFDIVFTVSCLDHIEDIDGIIGEFKRIANKAIVIAETNDVTNDFYFSHDYESLGFVKIEFDWTGADGAKYGIWIWRKSEAPELDDFAKINEMLCAE